MARNILAEPIRTRSVAAGGWLVSWLVAGRSVRPAIVGQFGGHTVCIFVLGVLLARVEQFNVVFSYRFVDHRDQRLLFLRFALLIAATFLITFGCFEIA